MSEEQNIKGEYHSPSLSLLGIYESVHGCPVPAGAMARRQRVRPRPPLQPLSLLEAELEGAAVKHSLNIDV